ncbi:hypothetical protein DID88_010155 [Monilinia fructigena]|uniref:Uncharacterized protein n=1 Tax=Monilinia fructigena TaxID=38457 RepID=A0A395IKM9_9HELO|nr:hypothetical protein DID88_010155 [Monilinia fructigena]
MNVDNKNLVAMLSRNRSKLASGKEAQTFRDAERDRGVKGIGGEAISTNLLPPTLRISSGKENNPSSSTDSKPKDQKIDDILVSATMGLSELDPTWMLSGIMMQIALQTGMHRPRHAQDFLKQTRDVSEAELRDRKLIWAMCNIVSQSVSTANGQPTITIYDWGLGDGLEQNSEILPQGIKDRLKIEKFCQKVSKKTYMEIVPR